MTLGRCKKESRPDSNSWFCSDLSGAREQETLWLDDMFLFNDNAEHRAGFWQSGFSWKSCWLSQVFGGPCRKGVVILEIYPVWDEQGWCWLSREIFPHKGKKWPCFPGVIQEWAMDWGLSQTFLWGFRVYPKNQAGLMDPCTSTPGLMLSFHAFQEAFAKPIVSAVGSAEEERVVHPLRQRILPYPWIVTQWEWSMFSSWATVPPFTSLQEAWAPSSLLTLSRLTWTCTCAF